jgi:tetratricopeptide (TPR) repeat protein
MATAKQFSEQGNEHLNKLQFGEAEKCFQSALKADANSIGARIGVARICILRKKNNEAENLVNDALQLAPQDADALCLRGLLYMRNEQWKEAIPYLEKARKADPKLALPLIHLARSYRKIGNLHAAEEAARNAIALNAKNAKAHAELAVVLIKSKKFSDGISEFVEAIRVNPFYIRPYLALGRLFQTAGKTELAIGLYRQGLSHNPRAIALQEELLSIYALQRNFVRAYKGAVLIALGRGTSADWLRVGNCAAAIGLNSKAEKAFKKSLEANSENWEAHYNLAELYCNAKLYDAAKAEYSRAIQLSPQNYKPHNGLGLLTLIADKNPAEAVKHFEDALKLAPQQKEPLVNMALASAARKSYAEAEKYARAALLMARPGDGLYEQAERLIAKVGG